jgi:hypothetical protein
MTAVVKIFGAAAGLAWIAFSAIALFATFVFWPVFGLDTVAVVVLPPVLAASAFWVAYWSGFRTTRLALILELLHLAAGMALLLNVSMAFREADNPPKRISSVHFPASS